MFTNLTWFFRRRASRGKESSEIYFSWVVHSFWVKARLYWAIVYRGYIGIMEKKMETTIV